MNAEVGGQRSAVSGQLVGPGRPKFKKNHSSFAQSLFAPRIGSKARELKEELAAQRALRGNAEQVSRALRAEFDRCGWPTKKFKVTEVRAPDLAPYKAGVFYLNLGYLRGLDPEGAYAELKALPDRCGHKRVLEAMAKLPERVEAMPASVPQSRDDGAARPIGEEAAA